MTAAQILFVQFGACLSADEQEHRMITLGMRLFLPFLAADEDLASKIDNQGRLPVVVVYQNDPRHASEVAERLAQTEALKGIPLQVTSRSLLKLLHATTPPPAGVFLSERLGDELPKLTEWGITHKVLTFSPFAGEVEKGVLGGVLITDRILPYLNVTTLSRTGIRLKPFFLKIAARYE